MSSGKGSKNAGGPCSQGFANLYAACLPLTGIFLLDVLPSRLSVALFGRLADNHTQLDSVFLAYAFTNVFCVFVLSLSCGLDTLSKDQLRNPAFLRYACGLVGLGFVPYVAAVLFAEPILRELHQHADIAANAATFCLYLLPYGAAYVVFAMLRKTLLQHVRPGALIVLMILRLCAHAALSYVLFEYTDLTFEAFALSDSCTMVALLVAVGVALCRAPGVSVGRQVTKMCRSMSEGSKPIIKRPYAFLAQDIASVTHQVYGHDREVHEPTRDTWKQYLDASTVPGAVSCLEWWAVEIFTLLVGATRYSGTNIKVVFLVHSIWSSLFLLFQMPMLGLSVAMAATVTACIRKGELYAAWYTLLQAMGSVLLYGLVVAGVVVWCYKDLMSLFMDIDSQPFRHDVYEHSRSLIPLFIIAIVAYSVAMCFLGVFVSVGRLARGGLFMLTGYYLAGLLIAVVCGLYWDWGIYGVWFGYATGFVAWCVLSLLHWIFTDWFQEMSIVKASFDELERCKVAAKSADSYGAVHINPHAAASCPTLQPEARLNFETSF